MRFKGLRTALFALALGAAVAVPAATQAATPITVGYVDVMDDAQVMVANEAGYYKAHGLDPKLVQFGSGTDLIKSIVSGQVDVGVLGFSNAFTWVSRGADLKIVGGAQMGYHALDVRDDSGITDVADLKGHTLASQKQGSTADIVLKGVTLAGAGLSATDVHILPVSPAVAVQSLVAGRVDSAFLFEPYSTLALLQAPVKRIYQIGDVWPFPCMVVITSGKTLAQHKDVIYAALDAQKEAIELLQNDPRKAAHLLGPYFIADPTVKTLHEGVLDRDEVVYRAVITQTFNWAITPDQVDRMKELAGIMLDQKVLQKPIDVDKVLDLSWQEQQGAQ